MDEARRLSSLDSLRGWAILAVVAIHSGLLAAPASEWLLTPLHQCGRGVQLFFLVSAFSLLHSHVCSQNGPRSISLSEYAIRRVLRIGPMFWLCMPLYVWHYGNPGWDVIALTVLFLHGWNPATIEAVVPGGWSIAAEAAFYLLLPVLFVLVTTTRRAILVVVLALIVSFFADNWVYQRLNAQAAAPDLAAAFAYQWWFPAQLPVFCLGLTIYHVWRDAGYPHGSWGVGLIALGVAALFPISRVDDVWIFHNVFNYSIALSLIVLGLVISPVFIFDNPIMRHIGKISYSIYILHFGLIILVRDVVGGLGMTIVPSDIGYMLGFCALAILSIGAATITYYAVELPFIRLGRSISPGVSRPSVEAN